MQVRVNAIDRRCFRGEACMGFGIHDLAFHVRMGLHHDQREPRRQSQHCRFHIFLLVRRSL
jgi:hypothetical protein